MGGAAAFAAELGFLRNLPRVSAAAAAMTPDLVRFDDQIEPLVSLIEKTPRERLLEEVAHRVRGGVSYQEVLAALLLAGVRNVQPRPSVGFKFHAVLCVNSCHQASLAGPDEDRWLPIFWALDYFKSAQADEAQKSGWRMSSVDEAKVPDATQARDSFLDAMDRWDVEQADAATAALVRTAGATEVFNLFARYAARDFRSIGHKAIFLANAWRTLQVIGWSFAEPVLRSLAFALLAHEGEGNPAENDYDADRPWREQNELISRIPHDWMEGTLEESATRELFSQFREATPRAAAELAAAQLARHVSAQSVWDGVFVGSGELLMRQPGIVGLHALTTANAMHYIWRQVADDELRRRYLLQGCAFTVMFREAARRRGSLREQTLDDLLAPPPASSAAGPLEPILEAMSRDKLRAAELVWSYLGAGGSPYEFVDASRRLLFVKGRDAHDYKFASAVLEDYGHVSPRWRNAFLATSVFNLRGSGDRDSALVERTRSALS